MFSSNVKQRVNWLISISIFSVTLIVTPSNSLDPINVPKFWLLIAFGFASFSLLLMEYKNLIHKENRLIVLTSLGTPIIMVLALLKSSAPLEQQLFGTFGRNTGLLTYFGFAFLFCAASLATNIKLERIFIWAFGGALGFNALYGLLQATGNDPIKWSNPYSPVIGTLGNPNFFAALLGMGVALVLPYLVARETKIHFRILGILYIAVAIFDIIKSDAQQGIIVSLLAVGLVILFLIHYHLKRIILTSIYSAIGFGIFLLAVLGTLQKGPLTSLIYKPSVTYRGDYWHAGLVMFKSNPLFGIGLDSFGDWYRVSRTLAATVRRGPSTVSNAAHNVFIDIAATAGVFALLAYILVIILGLRASIKILKNSQEFDPFFIGILLAWVGYLVQSIISINNIALGIWGWVLPGVLISKSRYMNNIENTSIKRKNIKRTDFSGMVMFSGLVVGAVIGFIPFNADSSFRHALQAGNPDNIYNFAKKWPQDVFRYNYAAKLFDQNKLQPKAIELARESVKVNPRNFDGWMYLYSSTEVSGNEKREALDRLKQIDPHNPDLKKLG